MRVTIVDSNEKMDRELFYKTFAEAIINSMIKKRMKAEKEKKDNDKINR